MDPTMRYRDRITAADLVLVSFPKSGRTWIRWFLQTYYQLVADVPFDLANPLLPAGRDLPPMAFTEDYFDVYADEPGRPYILFREELDGRRAIILVRDPRDIGVSYYHWAVDRLVGPRRPLLDVSSLDKFVRSEVYGVGRIAAYVHALLDYASDRGDDALLVAYEDLRSDPETHFRRLVEFLGRDVDEDALRVALSASSFESMQRTEIEVSARGDGHSYQRIGVQDWDGNTNRLKVRRGEVGGFRDEMRTSTRVALLLNRDVRHALRRMDISLW